MLGPQLRRLPGDFWVGICHQSQQLFEVEIWPYPPPIVVSVDFHPQHQETQKTNVSGYGAISGAGGVGGFKNKGGETSKQEFSIVDDVIHHTITITTIGLSMENPISNPVINHYKSFIH